MSRWQRHWKGDGHKHRQPITELLSDCLFQGTLGLIVKFYYLRRSYVGVWIVTCDYQIKLRLDRVLMSIDNVLHKRKVVEQPR